MTGFILDPPPTSEDPSGDKVVRACGPQIKFLAVFCHHTKAISLPIRTLPYDFLPSCTSVRMSNSGPGESIPWAL